MVDIKFKDIAGLLVCVIILSGGITYYLQETGKYKACTGGWMLREDGKYDCPIRDIEPQWCHHGSDEGPENIGYRCYLGVPINVTTPQETVYPPTECPPSSEVVVCDRKSCSYRE